MSGPNWIVRTLAVWDDGSGSALYAGGEFTTANGTVVNGIAKWDGATWSPLGTGVNGIVYDLEVWDGALYAGGSFTTAGGVSANRIARWDGTAWSAVSSGMNNTVFSLKGWNGSLYAGGRFITAGGTSAERIARWDGTSWSGVGGGTDSFVLTMEVWNGALYVAGKFSVAGNISANHIARWDGSAWSSLPAPVGTNGIPQDVLTMTVWDDGTGSALYVGGWFARVGTPGENPSIGLIVNRITKWDGTDWHVLEGPSEVGMPVHSEVYALTTWNDGTGSALYAGGNFLAAGGTYVSRVAKWDGDNWSALEGPSGPGVDNNYVYALAAWNDGSGPALFAGGSFTSAGGGVVSVRIAKHGCTSSDATAPTGPSTVDSTSHTQGGTDTATTIDMTWSGAADEVDGSGLQGYSIVFDDQPTTSPDTVVDVAHTTDAHTASSDVLDEGTYYFHLRACDNAGNCGPAIHRGPYTIDIPGPPAPGAVTSASHDPGPTNDDTIGVSWGAAAGAVTYHYDFTASAVSPGCAALASSTAGTSATSAALADGTWYFHVCGEDGSGNLGEVTSGGPYTIDSALSCSWQTDFSGVGGTNWTVRAMQAWNGALYVGGEFTTAGGLSVGGIARWDGTSWSALGTGTNGAVLALEVYDGALYAGGTFTTAGGVSANRIARWDGTSWSALSSGMNNEVHSLKVWNGSLYAGGKFVTAGGTSASRIASWDGTSWSALGAGTDLHVWAMEVWNGSLYAAGKFSFAGGISANHIARWDGASWSSLPAPVDTNGIPQDVMTLTVWDDGGGEALYAGGWFARVGTPGENPSIGPVVNRIVKYDGSWHVLEGPSFVGMPVHSEVYSLTTWNDGTGSALYAGGNFLESGGTATGRVARWDGNNWSALSGPSGIGVNTGYVYALEVWNDGNGPALFAGGTFTAAGGTVASERVGKFGCSTSDAVAPTGPVTVNSTSHTQGGSDAATTIDMTWSGAADDLGGTGLAGYSILFDDQPTTTPDDTVDVLHTVDAHTASSDVLDEGTYYFHIKACDNVGNCGPAIHRGPYTIDIPGPPAPGAVTSISHDPGPTNDDTIDVSWGAATGSVIYHYDFTASAVSPGCAALTSNTVGTSATSAALADGTWYFHVCGEDGSGNLGEVTTGGPYVIDSALSCSWQADFSGVGGTNWTVRAMQAWNGALYVGGEFTTAGGVSVGGIARWDGTSWSALGTGTNGAVLALEVYDGALYAGGTFTTAGGVSANRIARWDGTSWSAVSSGMNNEVHSLKVWNGSLYAGGKFITAGGTSASRIASWDGTSWSALGAGTDLHVWAMEVWNGALYAAGKFSFAGGISANHIARWDGATWSALPAPVDTNGIPQDVMTLTVWDDGGGEALYAGGWFARVGTPGENPSIGPVVNRIVKYDGSWHVLEGPSFVGMPVHSEVYSLTTWNDGTGSALYAGGNFLESGGTPTGRVARWDGSNWSALAGPGGIGVNTGYVYALEVWNDGSGPALFAGGTFTAAGGGVASERVGKFGCSTSDAVAPTGPVTVNSTSHTQGGSDAATTIDMTWSGAADDLGGTGLAGYSILFDGQPTTIPNDTVDVLHTVDAHTASSDVLDEGTYYFHIKACDNVGNCGPAIHRGPYTIDIPGPPAPGAVTSISHDPGPTNDDTIDVTWGAAAGSVIYHYDFTASAVSPGCAALTSNTVGTSATSAALADGTWYLHVCGEDGSGNLGEVATGGPYVIDSALRCSWETDFTANGTNWTVRAMQVWDDGGGEALYVGGEFTTAGGMSMGGIAKWDGSSWSSLGTGTNGAVLALEVYGGVLYAGGTFTTAGGVSANRIASWDGTSWSAVSTGMNNEVHSLKVWNGSLYAGGKFITAGGTSARRIASWDGTSWSALGSGTDMHVWAMEVWNGSLYAAGKFTIAGGMSANHIAAWDGTSWSSLPAPVDTNGIPQDVMTLTVWDDGGGEALYAGGWFARVGTPGENPSIGPIVNRIVKYDGNWHVLEGPSFVGMPVHSEVYSLTTWDDGTGSALYAGGNFLESGGTPTGRIARWDGNNWSALAGPGGIGVNTGYVFAMAAWDDGTGPGLFAGGTFTATGGTVGSERVGKFGCTP